MILLILLIIFILLFFIKERTIFAAQLKGISFSVIICTALLGVNTNFDLCKMLEKLTNDSILAAIGASIPAIYLYKYNFIEKEKSKLIEEYYIWRGKFEKAHTDSEIYSLAIRLESILSRKNNIKSYEDFLNLEEIFILIQEKLKDIENKQCFIRWKKTNSIILNKLPKCSELKLISEYWSIPETTINIVSVDFNQVAKFNLKYKDVKAKVNFRYCNLKKDFLENWEYLNSDSEYFFDTCSFDVGIKKDSFNFDFDINLEFKDCYIEGDILPFSKIAIDEIQNNESDGIYEERELGKNDVINKWLLTGKEIIIDISNNTDKIKIEKKIIQELKTSPQIQELQKKINIMDDKYIFSKSKNYCHDTKDGYLYEWRSWNVLSKEKAERKDVELYVFVVQLNANNNTKFVCLLFNKDKFDDMIKNLTLTKDKRYYFYFAKKNVKETNDN